MPERHPGGTTPPPPTPGRRRTRTHPDRLTLRYSAHHDARPTTGPHPTATGTPLHKRGTPTQGHPPTQQGYPLQPPPNQGHTPQDQATRTPPVSTRTTDHVT